jgi:hypothetical protein
MTVPANVALVFCVADRRLFVGNKKISFTILALVEPLLINVDSVHLILELGAHKMCHREVQLVQGIHHVAFDFILFRQSWMEFGDVASDERDLIMAPPWMDMYVLMLGIPTLAASFITHCVSP